MAEAFPALGADHERFIAAQHVFFVATSPLAADGFVNLSPKGLGTFAVLDATTVAYLDLTGSGVETIAHLRENGRIVIMFCAFEGPPKIVRLYGRGEVLTPESPDFAGLRPRFPDLPGVRSIIRVRVSRVAESCGYGVPRFVYEGERTQLPAWSERKGPDGVRQYQAQKNRTALGGLPGLPGDD
jgi:hypothetical protein